MGLSKNCKPNNPNGRPKGVGNKVTTELKTWITDLINNNRDQFTLDLKTVDADKRLAMIEKLMQYVIPKQQSISVEAQIQAEYAELERLLSVAPDEVIDKLSERIINLKNQNDETEN